MELSSDCSPGALTSLKVNIKNGGAMIKHHVPMFLWLTDIFDAYQLMAGCYNSWLMWITSKDISQNFKLTCG